MSSCCQDDKPPRDAKFSNMVVSRTTTTCDLAVCRNVNIGRNVTVGGNLTVLGAILPIEEPSFAGHFAEAVADPAGDLVGAGGATPFTTIGTDVSFVGPFLTSSAQTADFMLVDVGPIAGAQNGILVENGGTYEINYNFTVRGFPNNINASVSSEMHLADSTTLTRVPGTFSNDTLLTTGVIGFSALQFGSSVVTTLPTGTYIVQVRVTTGAQIFATQSAGQITGSIAFEKLA